MAKRIIYLLMIVIAVIAIRCGLFEPQVQKGSICIQLVTETSDTKLAKAQESLSTVRCILKKGSNTIHDQEYTKSGSSFQIDIKDLDPANNYSVLLYGKNSSADIIGRGYRSGISVTAGNVTDVSMSWNNIIPVLSSPADGSTITDNTPTFEWSDVNGDVTYELEVDNSSSFGSPEIHQTNLTSSNYPAKASLSNGKYYWRVRCKDSQGKWGGWSEVWSFTIAFDVPVLSVSTTSLTIGSSSGSNDQFNITSNTSWTVSDDASWLSVSPLSGSNNGTVTVTASSANTSTSSSRSATVTVSGGGISRTVSVTQSPADVNLTVSPSSLTLESSSGSNDDFNVTSNTSWTVSDDASWLSVSPLSGSNNGTVTVTASSANTSTSSSRSATVTVSGGGISRTVSVTQSPADVNLTVSPSSLTLESSSGSNDDFNVTSNTSWTVSDDASWLTVSPTSGSNNGTLTVTASSANTSTSSSRSATVTVSGGGISRTVSVTQSPAIANLTVSPSSLTLGSSSGSNDQFSVTSNTSWTVSDDASWLTVSPTSGSNNGTVTVTASSANTSTSSSRSAIVTVSGGGISRTVSVTQSPATANLTVSSSNLTLGSSSGSNDQFSVTSNTSWTVSDDASWLSVSPLSGSNNGTVTVTASSANTSTSSRNATVTVSGGGISRTVAVSQDGVNPVLYVSTNSLDFGSSSTSKTFSISNSGTGTLTWEISESVSWITSVSPSSGDNDETITVKVSRSGMSPGTYNGTVSVTSNGGNQNVSVSMSVEEKELVIYTNDDAFINSSLPNNNWSDSENLKVGWSSSIGTSKALIDFNFMNYLPKQAIITSAFLCLSVYEDNSTIIAVNIGMIKDNWSSTSVTWNYAPRYANFSYRTFYIVGNATTNIISVTEEVKWMIRGASSEDSGFDEGFCIFPAYNVEKEINIYSEDFGVDAKKPKLVIKYTSD